MSRFNFQRATVPESELEIVIRDLCTKWDAGHPEVRNAYPDVTTPEEAHYRINVHVHEVQAEAEVYVSDVYQVELRREPEGCKGVHMSINRRDRQAIRDWRDFQEIKNQLIGPECEGVELYPAESRRVDGANQYHIFCVNDPTYRFPFGFKERMVSEDAIGKSVQRPFEK